MDALGALIRVYGMLTCIVEACLSYTSKLVDGLILIFFVEQKFMFMLGVFYPYCYCIPHEIDLGGPFEFGDWQPSSYIWMRV